MGHHLLDSSQTSQVTQVLPGSPVLPEDMLVLLATVPTLGTDSAVTTADGSSSPLQGPVLLEELGIVSGLGWGLEESSVICLGAKEARRRTQTPTQTTLHPEHHRPQPPAPGHALLQALEGPREDRC